VGAAAIAKVRHDLTQKGRKPNKEGPYQKQKKRASGGLLAKITVRGPSTNENEGARQSNRPGWELAFGLRPYISRTGPGKEQFCGGVKTVGQIGGGLPWKPRGYVSYFEKALKQNRWGEGVGGKSESVRKRTSKPKAL